LTTPSGAQFSFQSPEGDRLPAAGYGKASSEYTAPEASGRDQRKVVISESSDRIQLLKPFAPWNGNDYIDLPILIKVKGKCTTDHITPAGPWFKYRGHLENISNNTLIGAVNAANDKVNSIRNVFTGEYAGVPETAKDYKKRHQQWVIIADHNYGEGSSREHAALQPRFLNGVAVIAKSFARIHESNLKKQGMLPLTFVNEADYDKITSEDRISLLGLEELKSGAPIRMLVHTSDGSAWEAKLAYTLNEEQVEYFKSGSALNLMAERAKEAVA
jgi:aconitate hydratase